MTRPATWEKVRVGPLAHPWSVAACLLHACSPLSVCLVFEGSTSDWAYGVDGGHRAAGRVGPVDSSLPTPVPSGATC